jgi:hypothetical protein
MLNRLVRSLAPAFVLAALPVASFAGVAIGVSINIAPPPLPVYVQPAPPGPDYIWTPGYWAWGDEGYYWVPGTWVVAPSPGLLWTPGYWGWVDGAYLWHAGYWGPHIGFYGGVNYGFGYTGVGYEGAYWRGGHVIYNRAVTNVTNISVTNVYNKTVVVNNFSHVSFTGGHGGIVAHATAQQLAAEHEHHFEPTPLQREHVTLAARDRNLRAAVNYGRPQVAATARPAFFSGRGVVAARAAGGEFRPAVARSVEHPSGAMTERNDRPPQAQREAAQHGAAFEHAGPQERNGPRVAPPQPAHMGAVQRPQSRMGAEPRMGTADPRMGATEPRMAEARMDQPHMDQPHMGQPHMGQPHMDQPHMGQPHIGQPEMRQPHMEQPRMPDRSAPQMGQARPSGGEPHFEQPRAQPHNEGPHGGGGRPEGHEGHQNRFR